MRQHDEKYKRTTACRFSIYQKKARERMRKAQANESKRWQEGEGNYNVSYNEERIKIIHAQSIPNAQIILREKKRNENITNSPCETTTIVVNGLIILNKYRCLNVILHFIRSFVRSLARISLFHCHRCNDTRLYSCVVICVNTLVRWESGTNGCSRPRTIHIEYNHLSRSIFPSLFHECISHACSLRRRRGTQ